jgi:hypothetical protein
LSESSWYARFHVLVVDDLLVLDGTDSLLTLHGGNLFLALEDGGLPAASSAGFSAVCSSIKLYYPKYTSIKT